MSGKTALLILVMAGVTYLIRMLPLTVIRKRIRSRFIRSFLFYIPYTVLAAMTFPAIFSATGNPVSAGIGCAAALLLGYMGKHLLTVAMVACAAAYLAELAIRCL